MRTFTGRTVDVLDPHPSTIAIVDIAHGLAHLCRFNGQTRQFYSVAQHSILVSMFCEDDAMLHGLLHDASEAYLGDVVSPLKHLPELEGYRAIEQRVQAACYAAFGLEPEASPVVDQVDRRILATEIRDLMAPEATWPAEIRATKAIAIRIAPVSPAEAETWFLERFSDLLRLRSPSRTWRFARFARRLRGHA